MLIGGGLAKPFAELETTRLWSITLQGQERFAQPLRLEFPFDPTPEELAGAPANVWVAWRDESRGVWVRAPAQSDAARRRVVVETDHLSTWWVYKMRGYDYVPKGYTGFFDVWYHPRHVNPRTDVSGQSMRELAEDVLQALETARAKYQAAGFRVPTVRTSVFIGDFDDSSWGKWGGSIDLRRSELKTIEDVRNEAAHELFHAVQNQYYYTAGMGARFWLIEGTPDFMAWRYAWDRPASDKGIEKATHAWFARSMFENAEGDDHYPTGDFLRYLDGKSVDLKQVWDQVAAWTIRADEAFRSAVSAQTGVTFETTWREFVDSRMLRGPQLALTAPGAVDLPKDAVTETREFTLNPGYTARAIVVRADPCKPDERRRVRVRASEGSLQPGARFELWTAEGAGDTAPAFLDSLRSDDLQSDVVELGPETRLVLLGTNTNPNAASGTLTATAEECLPDPSFAKTYPRVNGPSSLNVAFDVGFSLIGEYRQVQEVRLSESVLLVFTVARPAPGATVSYRLTGSVGGLVCKWLPPEDQSGCEAQIVPGSEYWALTRPEQPDSVGGTITVTINSTTCQRSADFMYSVKAGPGEYPPPLLRSAITVRIDGC
jgi:hypothetical protein